MPKHINADDIIKLCDNKILDTNDDPIIQAHNNAFRCVKHQIKMTPESIVRCKDCKYLVEIDDTSNLYVCDRINIGMDGEPDFLSPENDFCSRGERKEAE